MFENNLHYGHLASSLKWFFAFRISSRNNGREHRGTTSFTSDPHVQSIAIPDRHECYVYQARFTDAELITTGPMIYRNVEQSLSKCTWFGGFLFYSNFDIVFFRMSTATGVISIWCIKRSRSISSSNSYWSTIRIV